MNFLKLAKVAALAATVGLVALTTVARAEVSEVRISKGFGILYLPLIVMEDQKIMEKQAAKAGLGDVKVDWVMLDGGNVINDAMMSGTLDFAGTGAPGFITLWSKAKGIPNVEVVGISALSATSLWLNSNKPALTSLKDITDADKIALPGIKTSLSAVVLQMMVAHEFGRENFAKLDPMTVGLPHPEALAALVGGQTEINAHFTSPPFSYLELKNPKIHRVVNSVDVIGNITLDVTFAPKKFVDANPKMTQAFLDSLDEANAFIASNKQAAAEIFARNSKVKVSVDDVLEMLNDKDTQFSTTPTEIMDFADFMHLAGTIKVKPEAWTDLFIPSLHSRKGS
ncbi:ABC transporter substrate-binding protein [Rhizobium phaseoli]|jgi:NitT/TauT family transport system substrate-binding protein|uniref:ABC transporter substrate-binding protein n=1 Tax=Rhizobium phaseoli TaxID=396 RepID=A0A7K3U808_9HYPH|nr:ABC transporter substrate-binding protein [Rhizobium phaseoli]NEJ69594.1 ABC transporter substrate-binding protein [Rhizobium phaseoli]